MSVESEDQKSSFQTLNSIFSTLNPTQAPRDPVLELHGTRHSTPTLPSGDQSEVEPPGPIPNPEVKRLSANGSGTIGPVRVGRRQVFARIQLTLGPGSFFARMTLFRAIGNGSP